MNNQPVSWPQCELPAFAWQGYFPGAKFQKFWIFEHSEGSYCLGDSVRKPTDVDIYTTPFVPSNLPASPSFPCLRQVTERELALFWGESVQKIRDLCNPAKDARHCSEIFHPDDYVPRARGYLIKYQVSLEANEDRPRRLPRPKDGPKKVPHFFDKPNSTYLG